MLDIVVWCLAAVLLTAPERSDPWWVVLVLECQRDLLGAFRVDGECGTGNLSPLVVFVEGGVCFASAVMFEGLVFVVGRSLKTSFFFLMLGFSNRRETSFGSREVMVHLRFVHKESMAVWPLGLHEALSAAMVVELCVVVYGNITFVTVVALSLVPVLLRSVSRLSGGVPVETLRDRGRFSSLEQDVIREEPLQIAFLLFCRSEAWVLALLPHSPFSCSEGAVVNRCLRSSLVENRIGSAYSSPVKWTAPFRFV
ncbi:hypothetical protein Bca4012_026056 [Brassica carinata]